MNSIAPISQITGSRSASVIVRTAQIADTGVFAGVFVGVFVVPMAWWA